MGVTIALIIPFPTSVFAVWEEINIEIPENAMFPAIKRVIKAGKLPLYPDAKIDPGKEEEQDCFGQVHRKPGSDQGKQEV